MQASSEADVSKPSRRQVFDGKTVPGVEECDIQESCAWTKASLATRSKMKPVALSPGYRPWSCSSTFPNKLYGAPRNPRFVDCLDVSWGSRPPRLRHMPWYTDISQDVSWRPWSSTPLGLTTSSVLFDHARDQVWTTSAKLACHGWPIADLSLVQSVEDKHLHDLIGESMYLPSIGGVLLSIYLNQFSPWWEQAHVSSEGDSAASVAG